MSFGRPSTRLDRPAKPVVTPPQSRRSDRWGELSAWQWAPYENDEDSPGLEEWTRRRMSPTEQYLGRSKNKESGKYFLEIYPTDRCEVLEQSNVGDVSEDNGLIKDDVKPRKLSYVKPPTDFVIQSPALRGERRHSMERQCQKQLEIATSNGSYYTRFPPSATFHKDACVHSSGGEIVSADADASKICSSEKDNLRQSTVVQTWTTHNTSGLNSNTPEFSVYKDVIKQHQTKSLTPTKQITQSSRQIKSAPPDGGTSHHHTDFQSTSKKTEINKSSKAFTAISHYAGVYANMRQAGGEHEESTNNEESINERTVNSRKSLNKGDDARELDQILSKNDCGRSDSDTSKSAKEKTQAKTENSVSLKKISIQQVSSDGCAEKTQEPMFRKCAPQWTAGASTVKTILKTQDDAGVSNILNQVENSKYGQNCVGFKGGKISTDKIAKSMMRNSKKQYTSVVIKCDGAGRQTVENPKLQTAKTSISDSKSLLNSLRVSDDFRPISRTPELTHEAKPCDGNRIYGGFQRQAKAQSRLDIATLMEMCREQNIDYFPIGYLLPAVDSNIQSYKQHAGLTSLSNTVDVVSFTNGHNQISLNDSTQAIKKHDESAATQSKAEPVICGSKGFRGNTGRTPLQRARENTHKRLFGAGSVPRDADAIKTRWASASPHSRTTPKSNKANEEGLSSFGEPDTLPVLKIDRWKVSMLCEGISSPSFLFK